MDKTEPMSASFFLLFNEMHKCSMQCKKKRDVNWITKDRYIQCRREEKQEEKKITKISHFFSFRVQKKKKITFKRKRKKNTIFAVKQKMLDKLKLKVISPSAIRCAL